MPSLGLSYYAIQQLLIGCIIGCAIGIGFGEILCKQATLRLPLLGLMRFIAWGNVFTLWSMPITRSFDVWHRDIYPTVLFITIIFVSVVVVRIHLVARAICGYEFKESIRYSIHKGFLYAIVVWLLSQIMMSGAGWQWFAGGWHGIQAALLVILMVVVIQFVTKVDISVSSMLHAKVFIAELHGNIYDFLKDAILLILAVVILWEFAVIMRVPAISNSPLTMTSAFGIFLTAEVWRDVLWSHVELVLGLLVNISGGILLSFLGQRSQFWRSLNLHVLSLLFPSLFILTTISTTWFVSFNLLPKVVAIFAISYPIYISQSLAFANQSLAIGILVGLEQSLPFAFVGMLFAESMAGVSGLGVAILQTTASPQTSHIGTTLVLFVTSLLVIYSTFISMGLRHLSYSAKLA